MQADLPETIIFLTKLLAGQIPKAKMEWLENSIDKLGKQYTDNTFLMSFAMASRMFGNEELKLNLKNVVEADKIRKGWILEGFTICQSARVLMILKSYSGDIIGFKTLLDKIFGTGDTQELLALFAALPLYPHPKELNDLVLLGKRTNISPVFNRIALNNPYPAEYLSEDDWNQMILKAVFIDSPLYKIQGLEKRNNRRLATMLTDYAHERISANRPVTPELWRMVSVFPHEDNIEPIANMFRQGPVQQFAATLFCIKNKLPKAKELLKSHPNLLYQVRIENIDWETVGKYWLNQKPTIEL